MSDDYPMSIDFSNQFAVRSIDLNTFDFPKLRVRTWSNVFGKGGSYVIETAEGSSAGRVTLTQVSVEVNNADIHGNLERLVEEWNEDPRENWLEILKRNGRKVAAYAAKQVAEFDKVVAESDAATAFMVRLEELEEVPADAQ